MNRKLKRQLQIVDHFKKVESNIEKRQYEVNKQKSLSKKLKATERVPVNIEQTGGGVKYDFNTRFYELFRCELEKFFSSLETTMRCVRIPVSDNMGNFTECFYKIYGTDGHLYTVNMYHTRSSSLVNGKNTSQFVQTRFVKVLESMKKSMNSTNTTVEEVNRQIKAILLQCRKINIKKDIESDDCQRPSTSNQSAKLPLPSISETSEIVQEEKEDKIVRSNPGFRGNQR